MNKAGVKKQASNSSVAYCNDEEEEKSIDLSTVNVKKAAMAWHSLADPNATVRKDGVGTGQLHRRGRNFNPVDERVLLRQKRANISKRFKALPPPPPPLPLSPKSKRSSPPSPLTPLSFPQYKRDTDQKTEKASSPSSPSPSSSPLSSKGTTAFPKLVDKPFWNDPGYQTEISSVSAPKSYREKPPTVNLVDKPFWKDPEYRAETPKNHHHHSGRDEWGKDATTRQRRNDFDGEDFLKKRQVQENSTWGWGGRDEKEEGSLGDDDKNVEGNVGQEWEKEGDEEEENLEWVQRGRHQEKREAQKFHLDDKNNDVGKLVLIIHVEIDNNNFEHIKVHENDDPMKLAKFFCDSLKIENHVVELALVRLINDERSKSLG